MRILVVGSDKHLENEKSKNNFQEFCKEFGRLGADKGFEFVVGSESEYAPDVYIVEGANSSESKTNVHIITTSNRKFPFSANGNKYPNINPREYRTEGEDWSVSRVNQIIKSDCIVAVGGSSSTESAVRVARLLKKPVLLISAFKGKAKKLRSSFEHDYDSKSLGSAARINKLLYSEYDENFAKIAINCTERLIKHNPYQDSERYKPIFVTSYIVSLCMLWVYAFFNYFEPLSFSIFLLLGISSFLGSALRATIKARVIERRTASFSELINDTMTGLMVAFFFSLIYLVGGVTVKGDLLFLSSNEDFQRIGLTVSLLGASSSFLVEKSVARLRNTLGGFLDKNSA